MSKISRRDFLRLGIAGAGLMVSRNPIMGVIDVEGLESSGKSVSRTTGRIRESYKSACLQCYARCGIVGYVEYGKVVKIGGNIRDPNSRGRLCAKGQAGINHLYDVDRVLYPLKRVGKRGEGRWVRISWEEAYKEIISRLKGLRERGRGHEFAFMSSRDIANEDFTNRFLWAYGTGTVINHTSLGGANKEAALRMTMGVDVEINDVGNTKYILNFGSNPFETHFSYQSFAQRIIDGRINNGAKLVTFDVRISQTAGRSDEWIVINPGTDGLVALAMANEIMKGGQYDREFIDKWTNYSSDKLLRHLSQYTPEYAEKESGVRAEVIRRISREFVTNRPSTTISGGGVRGHENGTYNERCIALLNAVAGNIDIRGGYCLPRRYKLGQLEPVPPKPKNNILNPSNPDRFATDIQDKAINLIKEKKPKISFLMIHASNPAYTNPDTEFTIGVLKDEELIPFSVVIDSNMTETGELADIVLPEATYLERWELETPPSLDMVPFISLRQPVIKPLGESVAFTEILIKLAQGIGGGMERYFRFETMESYITAVVEKIEELEEAGGMDYLMDNGVWVEPDNKVKYKSYEEEGFDTPSGKFEIYSKGMEERGFNPLPVYKAVSGHREIEEDEFVLTTFQWNVHTQFQTANCMWLSEIVHTNPIWINAETSRLMGIKKGDKVKVRSKIGSIIAKAHLTEGIHQNVIGISDSVGHWGYGRVAQAKRFRSEDAETRLIWWEGHGNGVHPNRIIPASFDPIGGGQGWKDTVVKILKV